MPLSEARLNKICERIKCDKEAKLCAKKIKSKMFHDKRREREEALDLKRLEGEL